MDDLQTRIERLREDERMLVLPAFGPDDAWRIGVALRERAVAEGLGVALDIRRPSGAVLFHVALEGATADQDDWIRRKSALVFRFEASSALMAAQVEAAAIDPAAMGWLSPSEYALAGGSVPLRVAGAGVVAAVTASGLSSEADHRLVVDTIAAYAAAL